MKRLGFFLAAAWTLVSAVGSAAPVERELGQGLVFYRVQQLPADLPPAAAPGVNQPPCIVDVRYAKADPAAATAFAAWLNFRAKPKAPIFVLANADTAPALLRSLEARVKGAGWVVIGAPAGNWQPDLVVRISAEAERRAYDALENGAAIASIISDNPDKVRNDEASLSRDRLAEASADTAADALSPKRVAPPVDVALQRAIHLHRALLALRKL